MNILLTCAGRRSYMVEYFQEVVHPMNGKVFAINSSADSSALWVADYATEAPSLFSPDYPDFLLDYSIKNSIKLIISLLDIELPILSSLKNKFKLHGIQIVVADEWVTKMANDKWETYRFLMANGFEAMPTYINLELAQEAICSGKASFPLFVKPRWGLGSIGLHKAENSEELLFYYYQTRKEIEKSYLSTESAIDPEHNVLIQQSLPGNEYGLDVISNLNGEYQTTIVKRKLAMRSGETDSAITVQEPHLEQIGRRLSELTKVPGNMDVDVFYDGSTAHILEINPRFGGGYPFSHAAGVNLPKALVYWANDIKTDKDLLMPSIGIHSMKGVKIITKHQ